MRSFAIPLGFALMAQRDMFAGYHGTGLYPTSKGFLTFLPIWIVSYWFNTFFSQLVCRVKKTAQAMGYQKKARHVLSDISTVLSVVLLCFWIYVYVSQYTELLNFK